MADAALIRIQLDPALPCGFCDGARLAREGLAEADPTRPGLWSVLPICPVCLARHLPATPSPTTSSQASANNAPADDSASGGEPRGIQAGEAPPEPAHR